MGGGETATDYHPLVVGDEFLEERGRDARSALTRMFADVEAISKLQATESLVDDVNSIASGLLDYQWSAS